MEAGVDYEDGVEEVVGEDNGGVALVEVGEDAVEGGREGVWGLDSLNGNGNGCVAVSYMVWWGISSIEIEIRNKMDCSLCCLYAKKRGAGSKR